MFSTVVSKAFAILRASTVEGTNLPVSIELIACLETPIISAKFACVQFFFALSTLIVFFTSKIVSALRNEESDKIENKKIDYNMAKTPTVFV